MKLFGGYRKKKTGRLNDGIQRTIVKRTPIERVDVFTPTMGKFVNEKTGETWLIDLRDNEAFNLCMNNKDMKLVIDY